MRALLAALALASCAPADPPLELTAVTFNTGTTEGLPHDAPPDDGYTSDHAASSDAHYGDGLAWIDAVDSTRAFFDAVQPDIVAFQEVFFTAACADVPPNDRAGFVCEAPPEDVAGGPPSVANLVLGDEYAVACHPGKPDKCVAVRRGFGALRGCEDDVCPAGLAGAPVEGCGSGARVARAVIDLAHGGSLTVVNVHGSSGLSDDDQACRVAQFEQAFVDLDGALGASGERNLVLGDLNTDPGRYAGIDPSAARWAELAADFTHHTATGPDAAPTYGGLTNIDHVVSDAFEGDCTHPGLQSDPVHDGVYFDHLPAVCGLREAP